MADFKTLVGTVLGIHRWPAEEPDAPPRIGIHLQLSAELVNGSALRPLAQAQAEGLCPGTAVAVVLSRIERSKPVKNDPAI